MNLDKTKTIFDSVLAKITKMDKLKITIVVAAGAMLFLGMCLFLSINNVSMKHKLTEVENFAKKIQEDNKRLESERIRILGENDKLHADSVSYLRLNSKLEEEKVKLEKTVKAAKKILAQKENELQNAQISIKDLEKDRARILKEQAIKIQTELKSLQEKAKTLEETLNKERGLFHYNLAVAFTQAKLYDEAIETYEKSLQYNPDNADANYNLGLLYANERNDPDMVVKFYKEYLRLRPDADDKEEVESWIDSLKKGDRLLF